MRNLHIFMSGFFLCNIRLSYRALSTYRAATLLKLCSTTLAITIYLFLWQGIFGEEEVLNNFTLGELLLFVILATEGRARYLISFLPIFCIISAHGLYLFYNTVIAVGTGLSRPLATRQSTLNKGNYNEKLH